MVRAMKRNSKLLLMALCALIVLPAVGLWAAPHDRKPPAGISKDLINEKPPALPQQTCFAPQAVEAFAYRNNSLRVTTDDARNYDVSFFVQCSGLKSTDAVSFDGVMNDEVCGTGIESVIFYSTEQGPKRCAIKDVTRIPMISRAGR